MTTLFLISTSFANTSPCVNNVVIAPYNETDNFLNTPIEITQECYKGVIDNYNSLVYGHEVGVECYISDEYMHFLFQNNKISRCGTCIEITGPNNSTVTCMVTGSFKVPETDDGIVLSNTTSGKFSDNPYPSTELFRNRLTLLVSSTIFETAISQQLTDGLYYYEVSIRHTSCNFNVFPQLIMRNTSNAIIINAGDFIRGVGTTDSLNFPNDDGSFTIKETVDIRATNTYGSVIYWKSINNSESSVGELQKAQSMFSIPNDTSVCIQSPTTNVFNSEDDEPISAFRWGVKIGSTSDTLNIVNETLDSYNITVDEQEQIVTLFQYPFPFRWQSNIKHFAITLFSTNEIEFGSGSVFLNQSNLNFVNCNSFSYTILNKSSTDPTFSYEMNIHASFVSSDCYGYANGIEIVIKAPENTIVQIKEVYYERTNSVINYSTSHCSYASFSCFSHQCTIAEEDFDKENGLEYDFAECIPYCGECIIGTTCTAEGICENSRNLKKNKTQRKEL
ncbi:Uncharacterized protein QTN25_003358 [Entamoeba marina]